EAAARGLLRLDAHGLLRDFAAALVAVLRAKVVLRSAAAAPFHDLAGGHGHECAAGALDDLEIADDERVVDGDAAEGAELVGPSRHQLDADFRDVQDFLPGDHVRTRYTIPGRRDFTRAASLALSAGLPAIPKMQEPL